MAAERKERNPMRWLVIGGAIAVVVSTLASWASLPEPIAVRWEWGGRPNNSMPKLGYMFLWAGAWAFVASSLMWLGTGVDLRRLIITFVAGVLIAGHITTLENNLGTGGWQAAEPLDIPVALLLVVIGTAVVWLAHRRMTT